MPSVREIYQFDELTWPEVNEAVAIGKIPIIPVGSVEQHGHHLPLKVDHLCATAVATEAARLLDRAARLADGTITGSILTMDQALRNVLSMTDVSLSQAIGMLTLNPARAAQVSHRKGCLQVGYDADLAIFDPSLALQATICRGAVAFATQEWHERFATAEVVS